MRPIALLFLCLLVSLSLSAQQPPFPSGPKITGRISGELVDSLSGVPVEFATLVLIQPATQKEVGGVVSDEKGHFRFTSVPVGTYEVHITFIGYERKVLSGVALLPEKPDRDLGTVYLVSEQIQLEAVTVTGEASIIENRIDKLVYNAEKDVTVSGGDAAEVLRRVPLLAVDMDGNVSLRGSSNIQVLINGRPSGIFANNIADGLKTIPADQIKSVEVITTPSAKYDGEGSAGIINIITKKKSVEGFSGSVNASAGTRQNSANLNLNVARGRLGFNTNGNIFYVWPRVGTTEFYRSDITPEGERILEQSGESESTVLGYNGGASLYYDLNAYHGFSSSFRYNGFRLSQDGFTDAFLTDSILREYTRDNTTSNLNGGFDWTTDYRRTFKQPEREWTIAFQITNNFNNREALINQLDILGNAPELIFREDNENSGQNYEYVLQTDYVHPFSPKIKLEAGAKEVLRNIFSDYRFQTFDEGLNDFVTDPARTDIFNYTQSVTAGYVSLNIKLGEKYGAVIGARYEYTAIRGSYDSERDDFTFQYGNLLPSVILNRTLSNFSSLKLSYTQRIQRPSLFFINPYADLSDPFNITVGNPYLEPEVSHQTELAYNTYVKGISLNGALFYKYTEDIIENFLEVTGEGQSFSTYLNIGNNHSVGFNFFASANLKERLSLRGGFNLSTYNTVSTTAGIDLENQALLFNGNIGGTLSLGEKKAWKVETFGFYRARRRSLQGYLPTFSLLTLGFQREFMEKKASLGVRIVEPFFANKSFPSQLEGENFFQESNYSIPFRSYGANFVYRFGKTEFRNQRRSKIRNDDLKDGENSNF